MWGGATAFLLPLLLYAATRAPDLTFVDAGELAAAASTLGIAHPTGYPLFTLLGRTLVLVPGPLEPFDRLSLFSAACAATSAALVMLSGRRILRSLGLTAGNASMAALAASLTFAAGRTVWKQAVIVEVYALHLLFVALLVYLALRATDAGEGGRRSGGTRDLLLMSYVAGLATANHLSAALLLPAIAFLVVRERGTTRLSRRLPLYVLTFIAGVSVYIYLPVRSAVDPLLDWGDPETPGAFFRHATGAVYRVWFLSSPEVTMRQLGRFLALLAVEMTPVVLVPAAVGLVHLWRRRAPLAHATVLLFLLNLLYAVNYDIHDIDAYFLPAFLVVALWVGVGLGSAFEFLLRRVQGSRRNAAQVLQWGVALALPLLTVGWNAGAASQRQNHLVADYTAAMFSTLDPNAVVLSRQWDYFCSAAIYEQLIREVRRDVTVLEKELLRRSWYLKQLERWDPHLVGACRESIEAFKAEVMLFETGGEYSDMKLQRLYVDMINCLLDRSMTASRPVYLTPDAIEPGIGQGLKMIPIGLALRLYREPPSTPPLSRPVEIRALRDALRSDEELERGLAGLVLDMGTHRANYLAASGQLDEALAQVDEVLASDPGRREATDLRAALLAQRTGRLAAPPRPRPRRSRRRSGQSVNRPSTPEATRSAISARSLTV